MIIATMQNPGGVRSGALGLLIGLAAGFFGLAQTVAAAGGWSQPLDIGSWESGVLETNPILTFPTYESLYPRLAMSRSGLVVVSWAGSPGEILVARKPAAGAPWIAPVTLSGCGYNPEIAMDVRGDALVAWQACKSGYRSAFLPAGSSKWQRPVDLHTPRAAAELKLAFDSRGDAFAVWADLSHGEGEGGGNIEVAERASGSDAWTAPVTLLKEGPQHGSSGRRGERRGKSPHLVAWGDDDAVVVWTQSSSGSWGQVVESAVLGRGHNRWSAPIRVSPAKAFAINPEVALDARGDAMAAWEVNGGGAVHVESAVLPVADDRWTSAVTVSGAMEINTLAFVMDPNGEALAVWNVRQRAPEHEPAVDGSVRIFRTGRWHSFGPIGFGEHPTIAVAGGGRGAVVWGAGHHQGLQLVEADVRWTNHRWQPPVRISTPERHSAVPRVALDAAGEAVAVWFDRDGLVEAATGSWR